VRFEIKHEANGTVDLALDGVSLLGVTSGDPEDVRDCVIVGMTRAGYDSLATAMTMERTRELTAALEGERKKSERLDLERHHFKRSTDDALEQIKRLSDERDEAVADREELRDILRRENERTDAAIERERVAEAAYEELAEELERHRVHLRLAGEEIRRRKPPAPEPVWRPGWPFIIHTEPHDWTDTDKVTEEEAAHISATAPVGSLVDDLKNTIVSQAREIARLKGESA
jgi:hypothetical protein